MFQCTLPGQFDFVVHLHVVWAVGISSYGQASAYGASGHHCRAENRIVCSFEHSRPCRWQCEHGALESPKPVSHPRKAEFLTASAPSYTSHAGLGIVGKLNVQLAQLKDWRNAEDLT